MRTPWALVWLLAVVTSACADTCRSSWDCEYSHCYRGDTCSKYNDDYQCTACESPALAVTEREGASASCAGIPCGETAPCPDVDYACTAYGERAVCVPRACEADEDCTGYCVNGFCAQTLGTCQ